MLTVHPAAIAPAPAVRILARQDAHLHAQWVMMDLMWGPVQRLDAIRHAVLNQSPTVRQQLLMKRFTIQAARIQHVHIM